jgi:hypothetical protein
MDKQSPYRRRRNGRYLSRRPAWIEFWQNIVNGSTSRHRYRKTAGLPHRGSAQHHPDAGSSYSRHACLIHDFTFDPDAFSLDPDLTRVWTRFTS